MSDYLKFLSTEEYADKYGIYTPAVECDCGNACDGDEPKIYINECELCEEYKDEEDSRQDVVYKTRKSFEYK